MQTATPGVTASVMPVPPSLPASPGSRRLKPRHVIYKSSALERTAPGLVAAATADKVSAARSIQAAVATAEHVRLSYKATKDAPPPDTVGDDDASNAKKYERRLKMNRHSAAASRVRREAYTKALEAELVNMEACYRDVLAQLEVEKMRAANALRHCGVMPKENEDVANEDVANEGVASEVVANGDVVGKEDVMNEEVVKGEQVISEACFNMNELLYGGVNDEVPMCFLDGQDDCFDTDLDFGGSLGFS